MSTLPPAPQSAALPYRVSDGHVEVLLVTSRARNRWIVPKGKVEPGLGARRSAAREAFEEGGVRGAMWRVPLGRYRHGRSWRAPEVEVFLLHVDDTAAEWPEAAERRRAWFPLEEAGRVVGVPGLRPVLKAAAGALGVAAPGRLRRLWPRRRAA